MKVAITFFNRKTNNNNNIKINKRKKYNNGIESIFNDESIKIKNSCIIIAMFIAIFIELKMTNLSFLATDIYCFLDKKINLNNVLLGYNTIFNNKNYTIYEDKKEKASEDVPEEYSVLDKIAEDYLEQEVINLNTNSNDITVIKETDIYQKLNICGIDVVNYSSNRNINWNEILNLENINLSKEKDKVFL